MILFPADLSQLDVDKRRAKIACRRCAPTLRGPEVRSSTSLRRERCTCRPECVRGRFGRRPTTLARTSTVLQKNEEEEKKEEKKQKKKKKKIKRRRMQTQIDCKNIIIEKEKERDGVGWRTRGGTDRVGEQQWVEEKRRGTRDALSQGELLSFFVAALQKDRTKERRNERESRGPETGRFATSLRTPFTRPRPLCLRAQHARVPRIHTRPWRISLLAAY